MLAFGSLHIIGSKREINIPKTILKATCEKYKHKMYKRILWGSFEAPKGVQLSKRYTKRQ